MLDYGCVELSYPGDAQIQGIEVRVPFGLILAEPAAVRERGFRSNRDLRLVRDGDAAGDGDR